MISETEISVGKIPDRDSTISFVKLPADNRLRRDPWRRVREALAGGREDRPPADADEPPSIR